MGSVQWGFGWSSRTVLLMLGVPTLLIVLHLRARVVPTTLAWIFSRTTVRHCHDDRIRVVRFLRGRGPDQWRADLVPAVRAFHRWVLALAGVLEVPLVSRSFANSKM
ncbi:MAG: hypothetical protein ABI389_02935 [Rhodanobacter sp.]